MSVIGYARVSTTSQSTENQLKQLRDAGCTQTFSDTISGVARHRPGWEACKSYLRPGDTLVITALDRLARSLRELIEISAYLDDNNISLRSERETINTSSPVGRLLFNLLGSIAQFERELTRERSMVGLKEARARGRVGGRKWSVTPDQMKLIREKYDQGNMTVASIAKLVGTTPRTIYRVLERVPSQGEA